MTMQTNSTQHSNSDPNKYMENPRHDVATDKIKSSMDSGVRMAEHISSDVADLTRSVVNDVKSFTSEYTENLENKVKEQPMLSVGIAFAAGVLLSLMIGRA